MEEGQRIASFNIFLIDLMISLLDLKSSSLWNLLWKILV